MNFNSKIYIAGHKGLVGSSLVKLLKKGSYSNLILKKSNELDLRNQKDVDNFFSAYKPEYVFLLAAKVGGIQANMNYPAEFIYDNIMIQSNVIHYSYKYSVKKLIFLSCSCIYPKDSKQPMKEEYLLKGKPEPTNEAFALAKIAGIKMCQSYNRQYKTNFTSAVSANTYGIKDNFDLSNSHVISALIRKFHEAKVNKKSKVSIWGSGNTRREFIFVDDFANAMLFLMKNYNSSEIINIGIGADISISELAQLIKRIVGYKGEIHFDPTKPDGVKKKLLDTTKISKLEWKPNTSLEKGIRETYKWYLKNNG